MDRRRAAALAFSQSHLGRGRGSGINEDSEDVSVCIVGSGSFVFACGKRKSYTHPQSIFVSRSQFRLEPTRRKVDRNRQLRSTTVKRARREGTGVLLHRS